MSAAGPVVSTVTTPAASVQEGPVIITVAGQDPVNTETLPAAVVDPKVEPPKAESDADLEEPIVEETRERDGRGRFKGVQNRIDDLTRARRDAERDAEYWRARAQGPTKVETKTEPSQPPTREAFETDDAFIDAMTDFKVDQKLAARDQERAQVAEATSKAQSWEQKLASARTEIEGFDEVLSGSQAPVASHVAELIMEHDFGAKVAHYYASNPAELEKVNAMTPAKAAFEIGKIATKFEAAPAVDSSKSAAEKVVSTAPPPAARSVGAGRATTPKMEDLSMEDYIAQRRAQGAGWAR